MTENIRIVSSRKMAAAWNAQVLIGDRWTLVSSGYGIIEYTTPIYALAGAKVVRKRRFKDERLQDTYDWFRANKPGPETKGKGAAHNAYYVGRYVNQKRPFAVRGSSAYAGWAAGVDDAKEAETTSSSPPNRG